MDCCNFNLRLLNKPQLVNQFATKSTKPFQQHQADTRLSRHNVYQQQEYDSYQFQGGVVIRDYGHQL